MVSQNLQSWMRGAVVFEDDALFFGLTKERDVGSDGVILTTGGNADGQDQRDKGQGNTRAA
jgi:hypothetical protein